MATTHTSVVGFDNTQVETWTLGNADTGAATILGSAPFKTVAVTGTFGGATVVVEGSNDNTNFFTLNDPSGTPASLSFTAAGMKKVLENPIWIRARSSGGAGTAVVVTLVAAIGL